MITRIEALGFRSLRYVAQDVEPFQVLVGPNGSGKSSFLDVVGFVGDLLRVGPLRAILGDEKSGVHARAADPTHLCWMRQGDRFELAVELRLPPERAERLPNGKYRRARYEVGIQVAGGEGEIAFAAETLWLAPDREPEADPQRKLFPESRNAPSSILESRHTKTPSNWKKVVNKIGESGNDYFFAETSGWQNPFRLGPAKSALANLPEDETRFPVATWVKRILMEGIERVVLNAEGMRGPSPPGVPRRFRPDGSNLPWVVEELRTKSQERFERWVAHVRTALPDLKTIRTVERPEDRHRYLVVEFRNGLEAPSWVVSDGTLRLLALSLLAYLPEAQGIYLIEEPENGIHPRAVETVYQSLSSVYEAQVLCASHSPVVLSLARPESLLCFAKDDAGATDVVRGDQHPRLREWKGSLDLGTLFAAGVLGWPRPRGRGSGQGHRASVRGSPPAPSVAGDPADPIRHGRPSKQGSRVLQERRPARGSLHAGGDARPCGLRPGLGGSAEPRPSGSRTRGRSTPSAALGRPGTLRGHRSGTGGVGLGRLAAR